MKKILITATVLFLTACSSAPNIVGTNKPILNMAANLAPALDVDLSDNTAALKIKLRNSSMCFTIFIGITHKV